MSIEDRFFHNHVGEGGEINHPSTPQEIMKMFPKRSDLEIFGTARERQYIVRVVGNWKDYPNDGVLVVGVGELVGEKRYKLILSYRTGFSILRETTAGRDGYIGDVVSDIRRHHPTKHLKERTRAHLAEHVPPGTLIQDEGFQRI